MEENRIISLDEIKKIEIDILDDVVAFCEKNDIKYFLAYGTLLGAVRHKGFIPWDDDIDLHMPRPDYDKFLRLYNGGNNGNYTAIAPELNANYRMPFAKVYHKGTIVKEYNFKPAEFGVFIDLFPLDGYASALQTRQCGQLRRLMHVKNSVFRNDMKILRKIRLAITKTILLPFGIGAMIRKIKAISTQRTYNDCEQVFSSYSRFAANEIFPRAIFDKHATVTFEGKEYRAPFNYDSYLRTLYGNYMQLPPEENRISTHNSQAWYRSSQAKETQEQPRQ